MIPKLIHQTWKTSKIPNRWVPFTNKVRELNPDWKYMLWTDSDNDDFVKKEFPDFYDIFKNFSRNIMRADVIRYLIMYKIGGVYLDLDYEVLQPFDFGDKQIILPLNRSIESGDSQDELGNCFLASSPGHVFWLDIITELKENTPVVTDYTQIVEATGPRLLTRVYRKNSYQYIYLPDRLIYHPGSPSSKKEVEKIKNNGISLGIHHPWGSWKERWTLIYWKNKVKKLF
jgi:mannosyltransferase OCH1-like enzyme